MSLLFRTIGMCLLAAFALASCGSSESDQRAAFIEFLQKDVLAKPGVKVPQLNEERRKAFGDYAAQYDVITRFHETMNASVAKPMQQIVSGSVPRTLKEVVDRKADFVTLRDGMQKLRGALDQSLATADKERAALKQPDDLAPVYSAAYDKLVTQPAKTFGEIFPVMDDAFAKLSAFAELVDGARGKIKFNGQILEINDPALRAKAQTAMDAVKEKIAAVSAAQDKLRRSIYGN